MKRALLAFVLAAAAVVAWTAAARTDDGLRVVVRDADGARVAEAGLPASGRFALTYRHSVYGAPAEERFRAGRGDRGFVLEAIASPSQAVLDYYAVEGRRTRRGGRWLLVPSQPARYDELALAATAVGRRTLAVGGDRIALWRAGRARHLRIAVEGG